MAPPKRPGHVVVVGNEKGGSGKSTTAMHLAVGFLQQDFRVATIDLDWRQASLSRYVANRRLYAKAAGREVAMPDHYAIQPPAAEAKDREKAMAERLTLLVEGARINHDIVVVDTPGADSALSRLAHSFADTLITPMNDSFVDLDVLAHVDGRRLRVLAPSHYAVTVFEQRKVRAGRDGGSIDWIVMRNRLSTLDSRNAREVDLALRDLAARIGFRVVPGFSERVIFRELFLLGLTIMDLKDASGGKGLSLSHLTARQEVRSLIEAIRLA
jgi:chromosome partitioning protein